MLFNSHIFIFVCLPATLIGFVILRGLKSTFPVRLWLLVASVVFYSWWDPRYTLLLLASIATNYVLGQIIKRMRAFNRGSISWVLAGGITLNLIPLIYYKYATFIASNIADLTGLDLVMRAVVLPIGISFYTFQQIAYLVDVSKAKAKDYGFVDYALFVTFFPQLIAGPIVHHGELVPQLEAINRRGDLSVDFAKGIAFFVMGLVKKIVVADPISTLAAPVFATAANTSPGFLDAWVAVVAFSLGLYFDFSAYSDMAVGLGRMFGIELPYNFASPYQAESITDFWRRWHMTLSRFLRDYVYVPLGGNRRGFARTYLNVMLTMLIGGLWHGASWTFVIWGGLHGAFLLVNKAWDLIAAPRGIRLGAPVSRALTLGAVAAAWVFFASPSWSAAMSVLTGMGGAHGLLSPAEHGIIANSVLYLGPSQAVAEFGTLHVLEEAARFVVLAAAAVVALFASNSQQIIDQLEVPSSPAASLLRDFGLSRVGATCVSLAFVVTVLLMSDVRAFVYFQF